MDARGAEHHNRVGDVGLAQTRERIEILGKNAERTRRETFHEPRIFVCHLQWRQMTAVLHRSPSRFEQTAILGERRPEMPAAHPVLPRTPLLRMQRGLRQRESDTLKTP